MNNFKGNLYVVLSAAIFGFTPILGKLTYLQGSNAVMLTFLRAFFSVPILFCILKYRGVDLKITKLQAKELFILSFIGSTVTTVFLYQSYNYIPVGTATTLHFVYPLFVALGAVIIFKEHLSAAKITALILATTGITFFARGLDGGGLGIFLALVSGLTYAFYILYLDKSSLLKLHPLKLSFYINLIIALCVFIYGLAVQKLTFCLPPSAWALSLAVAVLCGFLSITLFQMGVKLTGATTSAILSMFEPITSVLCGILILKEPLDGKSLTGCALILLGVTVLTLFKHKKDA